MPDDAISLTLARALNATPPREAAADPAASPRVQLTTPEHVDLFDSPNVDPAGAAS